MLRWGGRLPQAAGRDYLRRKVQAVTCHLLDALDPVLLLLEGLGEITVDCVVALNHAAHQPQVLQALITWSLLSRM